MAKIKKNKRGFTLIELMIAAAITVLIIVELLCSFTYCAFMNESNNNLVVANNDAQYVMEQIKGLAFTDIASYSPPSFANLANETVTLSRNIGATLSSITVTVTWNERQRQRSCSLFTKIAK